MSRRGQGGKSRAKARTRSVEASLQFSVNQAHHLLRRGNYAEHVGATMLEHLAARGNAAWDSKKARIIPCHLRFAIRDDEELNKLSGGVIIAQSGVLPKSKAVLPPKRAQKPIGSKKSVKQVLH
ncbi:unnamed protein product [Taenia asiatica]|uniref:Histone_H2A_C domain-containing protein n=1 Tax=Taenia asiatica TaxID=60517 RepID=A0A0R3W0A9_TAEAS|nr:unnamed protein product [Taenia asiatica]